jgi:hypothetical protein
MRDNQRFRLVPASYQNDPEEGRVFYNQLAQFFQSGNEKLANIIRKISDNYSKKTVFVRSLTSKENTLVMWNSSYADNGNGVAIGIPVKKINIGQGIYEAHYNFDYSMRPVNSLSHIDIFESKNKNPAILKNKLNGQNIKLMPLWMIGLYKIMYLDKNNMREEIINIKNCLSQFEKNAFDDNFMELLGELFTIITHLVKDNAYEHEDEYRLIFINSIENEKQYIDVATNNGICDGIFIETVPILFRDDEERLRHFIYSILITKANKDIFKPLYWLACFIYTLIMYNPKSQLNVRVKFH